MYRVSKISLLVFIVPSTLLSMHQELTFPPACSTIVYKTLTPTQQQSIEYLYDTAATTIAKLKSTDDASINNLLQFIGKVHTFKTENSDIDEQYLGSFAHTKEKTISSSFGAQFSWTADPTHVALFFHLLKKYNNTITIAHKNIPTLQDWQAYHFNQSIDIDKIIEVGKSCGITITKDLIDKNKPPFTPIAPDVEITSFIDLVSNIEKLITEKRLITLRSLADFVYLNQATVTEQ